MFEYSSNKAGFVNMADKIAIFDMDKSAAIPNGRLYKAFAKNIDMDDGSSIESDIRSSPIEIQSTTFERSYLTTNNDAADQTNCENNAHTTTRDKTPINPGSKLLRQENGTCVLHRCRATYQRQQQRQDPRSKKLPLSHHELPTKLRGQTEHMDTIADPSLTLARMTKIYYSLPPFGNWHQLYRSRMENEGNQARLETILEEKGDEEREEEHEERGRSRRQRRG